MSSTYILNVIKEGEEKFQATLKADGEIVATFAARTVRDAERKAQGYAKKHKAETIPGSGARVFPYVPPVVPLLSLFARCNGHLERGGLRVLPPHSVCEHAGMNVTPGTVTDPAMDELMRSVRGERKSDFDTYQQAAHSTAVYPRVYTEDQVRTMMESFVIVHYDDVFTEMDATAIDDLLDTYETSFSRLVYPILGLVGEAGELANKLKKVARDQGGQPTTEQETALEGELGDVLWYQAEVATALGTDLKDIADENVAKLASRKERGVVQGNGDTR